MAAAKGCVFYLKQKIRRVLTQDAEGILATAELAIPQIKKVVDVMKKQIDAGKTGPAINQLKAFVNAVEALLRSGRLNEGQARSLIATAERMIDELGG